MRFNISNNNNDSKIVAFITCKELSYTIKLKYFRNSQITPKTSEFFMKIR